MVDYAKFISHVTECENKMGEIEGSLSSTQINTFCDLLTENSELIKAISEDQTFTIPPNIPFTKDEILNELKNYNEKLNSIIPHPGLRI